jgi:uncharacterized protein YgbK (DUF1537 family)
VARISLSELSAAPSRARAAGQSVVLESITEPATSADGGRRARALASAAAALIAAEDFDAVVCSGGTVAAAVSRQLSVGELELVGELGAAFALGETSAPGAPPLFALRSGGFGDADSLLAAFDRLMGEGG